MMTDYYQKLESRDYEASASSKEINLKLIFSNDVVSPVFTKQKIIGKSGENEAIKVILVDARTQKKVTTWPVAFAKVKIVLVRGSYDGTTTIDGEFEKNIVVDWGKKKNLLLGNVYVDLEDGSGVVGEIRIKHDKYPIRNVEFRLGAMVVDCPYNVKQAITQSFKVRDLRNTPKSLGSLSLTDKVWQLRNIRKYGNIQKHLESSNVFTVKDFLNMYSSNRQALQEIYGSKGKKWETTVNHAKTCNVGNAPERLGSTSQGLNTMPSFDGGFNFPQPYENDSYCKRMVVDENFSIQDLEECDMVVCFQESLPYQASRKDIVSVKAKKRWMKMRTLWFSIVYFMCGCAT